MAFEYDDYMDAIDEDGLYEEIYNLKNLFRREKCDY